MSQQHGAIERLDAKYKGLRLDVDLMFQAENTLAEVQGMLNERYKVQVPISTIGSYKERVFTPSTERIRAAREKARALREVIQEGGLNDMAEASIAEKLEEAMQSGEPIKLSVLLKEQRERARLQLDRDRLNHDIEALKLDFEKLKKQHSIEKAAVEGVISDASATREQVAQKIRDIFGVSSPGSAAPGNSGAALPGPLDQGQFAIEDCRVVAAVGQIVCRGAAGRGQVPGKTHAVHHPFQRRAAIAAVHGEGEGFLPGV